MQLGLEARLGQPRHRLAHLADRTALEREAADVDDRLVPDVHRVEPEPLVQRAQALAGAERAELQAAVLSELPDLPEQPGDRVGRSHRVAGQQQHAVLDRVRDERPPVLAEDVMAVGAQLEERERVGAVRAHEV